MVVVSLVVTIYKSSCNMVSNMETNNFMDRRMAFLVFTLLLVVTVFLTLASYFLSPGERGGFLDFVSQNHLLVMVILVVVSISYGYFTAYMLYKELDKTKKTSKEFVNTILKFLEPHEKKIVNYLIECNGKSSQAELSRLEGLTKVKVHRSLKKMEGKDILKVRKRGKVRDVILNEELYELLKK